MIINSYKLQLFFIFFILTFISKSQETKGFRIGAGIGSSVYWGSQMDGGISFNTSDKSEVNRGLNVQLYKEINNKNEIGFRFLDTELWSFKSGGKQAFNAKIKEFALMYQRNLNKETYLYYDKFNFLHRLVAGICLISFQSKAYDVDPSTNNFTVFSSVGNGIEPTSLGLIKPDPQLTLGGILGYNIGVKLNNTLTLYLENTFTLSASNYINGNLKSKSKFMDNGYTYNALTLYINLNKKENQIGCPKF